MRVWEGHLPRGVSQGWLQVRCLAHLLRPTWFIALVLIALVVILTRGQSGEVLLAAADPAAGSRWPLRGVYFGTTLLAFSNWYCARALLYLDYRQGEDPGAPRVAASLALSEWGRKWRRRAARFYGCLAYVCVALAFAWSGIWQHALGCAAAGAAFLAFAVLWRRFLLLRDLDWVEEPDRSTVIAALIVLAANAAVFLLLLLLPVAGAQGLGASGIVLACLAGWVVLGSGLVHLSYAVFYRRGWPRPTPFLAAIAVTVAAAWIWDDPHPLRPADCVGDERVACAARDPRMIRDHFAAWLRHRPGERVPVVLVTAEGGGLRAAYWTASVLGRLSEEVPGFACHVYAVSTSSGGNLGAAVWLALLGEASPDPCDGTRPAQLVERAQRVLSRDLISPAVGALLTRDLVGHFLPPLWEDRTAVMERALEEAWKRRDASAEASRAVGLSDDFHALWGAEQADLRLPSLLLNASRVETGGPAAFSNLSWTSSPPVTNRIEDRELYALDLDRRVGHPVAVSTAAVAGARFPVISPAAAVRCPEDAGDPACKGRGGQIWDRIVDAGYFDNSAAFTALDLRRAIEPLCENRCRFVHIAIVNDPYHLAVGRANERPGVPSRLYALFSPVVAFMRRDSAWELISEASFLRAADRAFRICLRPRADQRDPALGWLLHEGSTRSMAEQLPHRVPLARIRAALEGGSRDAEESPCA